MFTIKHTPVLVGLTILLLCSSGITVAKEKALSSDLATETAERMAADAALQGSIDAETIARQAGDDASQTAIDKEALARGVEDTTLQGAIDAEIAERKDVIEGLIGDLRFVVTPPEIFSPNCLIGAGSVCVTLDGEIFYICPSDPSCNDDPIPYDCPEACEDRGGIVVVDHRSITCTFGGVFDSFVCMNPEEYAARPSCPESTVLNYNSDKGGWDCQLLVPLDPPVSHATTDIFDLIGTISLFERARTDSTDEELQSQIDNINLCVCPGVFTPVCGDNSITYVNDCEAQCANQAIAYDGACNGQ
jgi:hypothetical protein